MGGVDRKVRKKQTRMEALKLIWFICGVTEVSRNLSDARINVC